MLNDSKFWAEAVSTAAYLVNRCPALSLESVTPEEAWSGIKPTLQHLKIFGSKAMIHVPKQERRKFGQKATEGIFVGYVEKSKGYRVFNPSDNSIVASRDVS